MKDVISKTKDIHSSSQITGLKFATEDIDSGIAVLMSFESDRPNRAESLNPLRILADRHNG